jgi:hypothetical protein
MGASGPMAGMGGDVGAAVGGSGLMASLGPAAMLSDQNQKKNIKPAAPIKMANGGSVEERQAALGRTTPAQVWDGDAAQWVPANQIGKPMPVQPQSREEARRLADEKVAGRMPQSRQAARDDADKMVQAQRMQQAMQQQRAAQMQNPPPSPNFANPGIPGVPYKPEKLPEGFAHGGQAKAYVGDRLMNNGGKVPGKAKHKGDDYRNDTVKALLSPGEIVLPNSVTQSKDPVKAAAKFVEAIVAKQGLKGVQRKKK